MDVCMNMYITLSKCTYNHNLMISRLAGTSKPCPNNARESTRNCSILGRTKLMTAFPPPTGVLPILNSWFLIRGIESCSVMLNPTVFPQTWRVNLCTLVYFFRFFSFNTRSCWWYAHFTFADCMCVFADFSPLLMPKNTPFRIFLGVLNNCHS